MTTSTIGTLGGETYSTIQAWEDAAAATLSATWEGELSEQEFTSTSTLATFAGITASATNFIELRPASGAGFKDDAGAASNPLRYDSSKGAAISCTGEYAHTIDVQISYVRLRGLQIKHTTANNRSALFINDSGLSGILARDCILELQGATGASSGVVLIKSGTIENCCAVNRGTGNGIAFEYAGTVAATNCTVVRPSDVTAASNSFIKDSGTITITNCAGFGFSAFSSGSGFSGSNNASDQTIGFGTSNQASLTYSSQFEVVTDATRDFRAKSGGALINNGTTGTTGDIIGQAASGTKDIGAWELQAGGGGAGDGVEIPHGDFTIPSRARVRTRRFATVLASGATMAATTDPTAWRQPLATPVKRKRRKASLQSFGAFNITSGTGIGPAAPVPVQFTQPGKKKKRIKAGLQSFGAFSLTADAALPPSLPIQQFSQPTRKKSRIQRHLYSFSAFVAQMDAGGGDPGTPSAPARTLRMRRSSIKWGS